MKSARLVPLFVVATLITASSPALARSDIATGKTIQSTVTIVPVDGHSNNRILPKESANQRIAKRSKIYTPLEQALAQQRSSNQFHDVHLTDIESNRLAITPKEDWPTKDECIDEYTEHDFEGEWQYHNNYSACQVYYLYFNFQECETTPPSCKPVGQTEARAVFLGKGWATARSVDWDIYLDKWRLVWGREEPTHRFKIDIECETYEQTDKCNTTSAQNTRSLAEWKANGLHNVFNSPATPTPWPGDERPQDKRAYFQFTPKITALTTGDSTPTYWVVGRCDNASYVTGAGCVFQGTWSRFVMDYNYPNYKESVQFIWDAMHDLPSVKPGSVGLYVPGGFYTQPLTGGLVPLTRNYYGTQSRTLVQAECVRLFGSNYTQGPNGEIRDCDEYPFASTYQSANYDTLGTASTWAVKALDRSHNRSAGSILGDYYVQDHILDEDPFFVHIINTPTP